MRTQALFALLVYALIGTAGASTQSEIEKCAAITNAAERLFCFDNLAASLKKDSAPVKGMARTPAAPGTSMPTSMPRETREADAGSGTSPAAAQKDDNAEFGLEDQKVRESASSIRSRYKGSFNGWSGDTVFELENGQVWQQSDGGRMAMKAESPMITITRGWFGAYFLKVDGYNKRIRVKRIK